jgi:hypothetical protein
VISLSAAAFFSENFAGMVSVFAGARHRERAVDERSLRRLRIRSWRLLSDREVKTRSKRKYRKNHSHGVPLPCRQWSRVMV